MEDSIDVTLSELSTFIGYRGAVVSSTTGEIIAIHVTEKYIEQELTMAAHTVIQTLGGLSAVSGQEEIGLEFIYREGRLLAQNLDGIFLCVLSDRDINLPLLYQSVEKAAERIHTLRSQ